MLLKWRHIWTIVDTPGPGIGCLWNKRLRDRAPLGTPGNVRNGAVLLTFNTRAFDSTSNRGNKRGISGQALHLSRCSSVVYS
jgi:hypothetical protein